MIPVKCMLSARDDGANGELGRDNESDLIVRCRVWACAVNYYGLIFLVEEKRTRSRESNLIRVKCMLSARADGANLVAIMNRTQLFRRVKFGLVLQTTMVCEFVLTEPCLWAVGLMSLVSVETNYWVRGAVSEAMADVSIFFGF